MSMNDNVNNRDSRRPRAHVRVRASGLMKLTEAELAEASSVAYAAVKTFVFFRGSHGNSKLLTPRNVAIQKLLVTNVSR